MRSKVIFLPNIITAFGLSCGLFAMFRTSLIPQGMVNEKNLTLIAGILLLAALADVLDGAVARAMKAESAFGGLFDSLADAISFGVAPSLVVIKSLPFNPDGKFPFVIMAAALVYSLCGVLRLIRFNIEDETKEEMGITKAKHFTGLPIPAAAAALISLNLVLVADDVKHMMPLSDKVRLWILFSQMIVLGYFMISRWKFPSIKTLRVPVASFELVFVAVLGFILIFYGLLNHFPFVSFAVAWGYILIAWALSLVRIIAGKKSKTLIDFEPDDREF